jgi:hypothetical protein
MGAAEFGNVTLGYEWDPAQFVKAELLVLSAEETGYSPGVPLAHDETPDCFARI